MRRILEGSCAHVNLSWGSLSLKGLDKKIFNHSVENLNETIVNEVLRSFFQQLQMCSESETSKLFNLFIHKKDGVSANQFQGVHLNEIPFAKDLLTLKILLYDMDIVDGNIIGEFARRNTKILCEC